MTKLIRILAVALVISTVLTTMDARRNRRKSSAVRKFKTGRSNRRSPSSFRRHRVSKLKRNWKIQPRVGTDNHELCCFWATSGACDRNPHWMRPHCQVACGTTGCPLGRALNCKVRINTAVCGNQRRRRNPNFRAQVQSTSYGNPAPVNGGQNQQGHNQNRNTGQQPQGSGGPVMVFGPPTVYGGGRGGGYPSAIGGANPVAAQVGGYSRHQPGANWNPAPSPSSNIGYGQSSAGSSNYGRQQPQVNVAPAQQGSSNYGGWNSGPLAVPSHQTSYRGNQGSSPQQNGQGNGAFYGNTGGQVNSAQSNAGYNQQPSPAQPRSQGNGNQQPTSNRVFGPAQPPGNYGRDNSRPVPNWSNVAPIGGYNSQAGLTPPPGNAWQPTPPPQRQTVRPAVASGHGNYGGQALPATQPPPYVAPQTQPPYVPPQTQPPYVPPKTQPPTDPPQTNPPTIRYVKTYGGIGSRTEAPNPYGGGSIPGQTNPPVRTNAPRTEAPFTLPPDTGTGEETPTDTGEETPTDTGEETPTDTGEETPTDTGEETPTDTLTGEETPTDEETPTGEEPPDPATPPPEPLEPTDYPFDSPPTLGPGEEPTYYYDDEEVAGAKLRPNGVIAEKRKIKGSKRRRTTTEVPSRTNNNPISNGRPLAELSGPCEDQRLHCGFWKTLGECQKNVLGMKRLCRKTCQYC